MRRTLVQPLRRRIAPTGAGGDVPRQQVLVGRVHVHRVRRLRAVVEQRRPVARAALRSANQVRKAALSGASGGVDWRCMPAIATLRRLCVMLPVPTINTPSSANGASAWPSANSSAGLACGDQPSGSTGTSAAG